MAPKAPAAPATPKAAQDPIATLKRNPAMAAVAGGALLGLIVLMRSKKAATDPAAPVYTANTTASDLINQLQPEIDALARQIANPGAGLPTTPGGANPLTPPPAGSGSLLVIGGANNTKGVYGPGETLPAGASAVCQGGTCLSQRDFESLGRYLDSLPGGHG